MNIKTQKYFIISSIVFLNAALISTFVYYSDFWYAFIPLLASESIINSAASIILLCKTFINKITTKSYKFILSKNYVYVIPCYNESEDELTTSINSLVNQNNTIDDKRLLFIVCDGMVKGVNNELSTDKILKKILKINETADYYDYMTWDNTTNIVKVYCGQYQSLDYILFVKEKNYGKRDSLVLVRRLCYKYNFTNENDLQDELSKYISQTFKRIFYSKIDYIIGIDADTVFDTNCTKELIKGIESDNNIFGCVGYVDISSKMNPYSLFTIYQYGEYMYSQCLKRYAQSNITHTVTCLSGCNQILRVSEETCGDKILNLFNRLPKENEHIFNHIRSYASEDRNHVCLMLSLYPYVKTVQTIQAKSYTTVPNTISVFASQRRRWNLGANCNDILLIHLPGINFFERISAFVNVLTFITSPFILVATAYFFKILFTNPPILMLYLSIVMIIPFIYSLLIPIIINPLSIKNLLYYYLSYSIYLIFGSIINILTYSYALINMDIIKWGKTRNIKNVKNNNQKNNNEKNNKNDNQSDDTDSIESKDISVNSLIYNFEKYISKNTNQKKNDFQFETEIDTVDNQLITELSSSYNINHQYLEPCRETEV
jgi:chitin synthase